MSGKDLAAKLRDLGFSHIKSHMTALDEFELLQAQGVLEAHGFAAKGAETEASSESAGDLEALSGGLIRRKKKKKKVAEDESSSTAAVVEAPPVEESEPTAGAAPAEVAEPVAAAEPAVAGEPQAPVVAEPEPATQAESEAAGAPAEVVPVEVPEIEDAPSTLDEGSGKAEVSSEEPAPDVAVEATSGNAALEGIAPENAAPGGIAPEGIAPEKAAELPSEVTDEPTGAEQLEAEASETKAESLEAGPVETEPSEAIEAEATDAEAGSLQATEAEQESPEADDKAEADDPLKGKKKKKKGEKAGDAKAGPAGKVVGFIDLSKIQAAPKKSESRRLRSRDDVLPDVRPTLRHDSRRSMLRGDRGSRDSLTAAQLREREAGRYRRHQRPSGGAGGRGSRGGRGGYSARPVFDGSPHSGSTIKVDLPVTIKKLAEALAIKGNQLMKVAFREIGFGAVTITSVIDEDTATLLAGEFEVELEFVREVAAEEILIEELRADREAVDNVHLERRNPTVAFLGHVDHGKTTLIDKIRSSQVADGESGGITQHIGAYRVKTEQGHYVTIIDTPGHAAFTSMRARGASAVDVVVLVVAADAGVQPQTEEALNHAKAAGVPIVVALNKIDRAEANPQKAQEQLAGLDLIPEEWGGETAIMPVSGITGEGLQELLERIFLESEILELECHPDGPASGVVLEAEVQQGKGIVAHLLVQDGTLHRGGIILAGEGYGKVRSLHDDYGKEIEAAGPSVPVEVSGLSALPGVGEPFHVVKKLDNAKKVAEERSRNIRTASMAERRKLDNVSLLQQVAGPKVSQVNLVIRADVQGSAEVLKATLSESVHVEVETRIIQSGVGAVTENDVLLASTGDALIIAFNVGVNAKARQTAEREGVQIRNYSVLYNVIDDVREIMEGRLAPEVSEEITGHTEIRRLFRSSKIGNIAGCMVLDGSISRDSKIRLLRDDQVLFTGTLASLRRESDDAKEVREGFECGLVVKNYGDVREGDIIESFKTIETKRTLDSAPLEA